MTARQIQTQINYIGLGSVMSNLKKLTKHNNIKVKESNTLTKTGYNHPTNKYKAT